MRELLVFALSVCSTGFATIATGAPEAVEGYVFLQGQSDHAGSIVHLQISVPSLSAWAILVGLAVVAWLLYRRNRAGLAVATSLIVVTVAFGATLDRSSTDGFYRLTPDSGFTFEPGTYPLNFTHDGFVGETVTARITDRDTGTLTMDPVTLRRPCTTGTDSDGDRLDDCYESNTGMYVDEQNTGTDPFNPDTDGDGLSDGDEVLGTTDGLDLPGMGSDPLRQDIFLEYDWFEDNAEPDTCGPHSHRPTPTLTDMVTDVFANAPITNPDGSTGISVHHDYGQGGMFTGGNHVPDSDGVIAGGVQGTEFAEIKNNNFASNREGAFHYVLLPHRYDTDSDSSGQAELPGDDMIVSLYCFHDTEFYVAATIVHELGHNLDLRHGGGTNCNFKPNYNSVMNYEYQFGGVDDDCEPPGQDGVTIDYSYGDRLDLDENALHEPSGTCGTHGWDWNRNFIIDSGTVSYDINGEENEASQTHQQFFCGGEMSVLEDYDDWANLNLPALDDGADGAVRRQEIISCDNPPPGSVN